MIDIIRNFFKALKQILIGDRYYYMWVGFLSFFVFIGLVAYGKQASDGLIVTAMRDPVSWGLYISNFTFLVGVAAAAVVLVVPAYLYHFKPIKEIVLLGEMMAVTAVILCILFVVVDMGQPLRLWHLMPFIGAMNFPSSLLAWDVIVLSGYFAINLTIVLYVLYQLSLGKEYSLQFIGPLIILSIPWAVGIHTVTAFLYNGLPARPFWNSSILAPRFLASAFCSGPALLLVLFQVIRKVSRIEIEDRAIFKIAELIAYAMCINIFLEGAEIFKEFYSGTIHVASIQYLYFGLHGNNSLVPWIWWAVIMNLTALILFLNPRTRENFLTLNTACIFTVIGIYIEKGMGLVVPGFVPGTLGEIYDYSPTNTEILITMGIWAFGALIYTLMLKFAIPIYTGELRFKSKSKESGKTTDADLQKELLAQ